MGELCHGICKIHGKPCLASIDPKALCMADMANAKLLGNKNKNKVIKGVLQHRHVCEDCLHL
jgi:hypothetical protein